MMVVLLVVMTTIMMILFFLFGDFSFNKFGGAFWKGPKLQ